MWRGGAVSESSLIELRGSEGGAEEGGGEGATEEVGSHEKKLEEDRGGVACSSA
jgi:hypothetical protein